ncbi:MAG: response regulator transcription factor [Epulopiscium sp.]|nr:response regulator transcription factor [Candidatus Epulonipiscium sp.]
MENKKNILIVDDEKHILELLQYNLVERGYHVIQAETGEEALEQLKKHPKVDGILLDLLLPGIDGLEVLRRIRSQDETKHIPVIMLTAKNEELDTVLGLEMGADDYIGKPFRMRELLARLKAVLRRNQKISSEKKEKKYSFGNLEINETTRQVIKDGVIINMPLKEFELLLLLASYPDRVFTREELLEKVWGYDYFGETRTVDVHIRYIRQKIEEDDKNPKWIKTLRGVGYKFTEEG